MEQKYDSLIQSLRRFSENSKIELNEIETFAGKSLIYFIPGEPRFDGSWRLWISSRENDVYHVILDNVDRSSQRVGISFPCSNPNEVYDRLGLALKLAQISNQDKASASRPSSEDLKTVADSRNLVFVPRSLLQFRPAQIRVPSQKNPMTLWTVWIKRGELILTRKGLKRTPASQIPNEETAGYLSFKSSGSNEELIQLLVTAAALAF